MTDRPRRQSPARRPDAFFDQDVEPSVRREPGAGDHDRTTGDPYGHEPHDVGYEAGGAYEDEAYVEEPYEGGYGEPAGAGRGRGGAHFSGGGDTGGRRPRRGLRVALGAAVVLLLVVVAGGLWVVRQIDPPGGPGPLQEVVIPPGATSGDIGDLLADRGIIKSATVWGWYLRVNGGGPFQAGLYELAGNSAMGDVVDVLSAGPEPPDERRFTVPEGLTLDETIARLADPERGLGLDPTVMHQLMDSGQIRSVHQPADQPSNEGILLPETYQVAAEADEAAVLGQMVALLDATLEGLDVASAQERFNLTPYEILIVASLIEEETKVAEERPMVARVIYNRLREGIALGIDATSRYEAELAGRDRGSIDFSSDSPYNTRRRRGLPPTPIASPGRASIEAALNPAEGPWTYYVLEDSDGHHFFTDSNSEFLEAKARCKANGLGCG